jgi:hypothetical protein
VTRSIIRTLLAAGIAAAVLTGCAETGLGVAARVGDKRITNESLRGHTDRGYVGPVTRQAQREEMQRAWLSQLVKTELYREAARRLGVRPSEAELTTFVEGEFRSGGGRAAVEQQYASQGVAPADLRSVLEVAHLSELIGDALVKDVATPDDQLRKAYDTNLGQFDRAHIAHIKVKDRATADRVIAQVRGGASFAELAKQSTDTSTAATGGELGIIGNGPGEFEAVLVSAVFKARTGAVLGPIQVRDGFEIVKVVERVTVPFERARDELRRGILAEQRTAATVKYLKDVLADLGLTVNPRYGRWDDQAFRVAAGPDQLSSPAVSQGVQAPGGP